MSQTPKVTFANVDHAPELIDHRTAVDDIEPLHEPSMFERVRDIVDLIDEPELREAILGFVQDTYSEYSKGIRYMITRIIESKQPDLEARILAYSCQMVFDEESMAHLGERYGVTRADIHKRVKEARIELNIRGGDKVSGASAAYRMGNIRRQKKGVGLEKEAKKPTVANAFLKEAMSHE